jgi:hypothetical protein
MTIRHLALCSGALALLAGCALTAPYAVYRHATTGDVLACESSGDVYGPAMYSACKDAIEARGYVRVGTEQREMSARTGVDYATPRPLPAK